MSAKLTPFVPGGFFSVGTIIGLYRVQREHGHGRAWSIRSAIVMDWLAWRRAREAQREDARDPMDTGIDWPW